MLSETEKVGRRRQRYTLAKLKGAVRLGPTFFQVHRGAFAEVLAFEIPDGRERRDF